ncbi:MAG: hypothetical protein IMW89_11700 [Ktedonobacteraceae bacterium]|nr:hypothetical protein [Ktedonobacteraceae bacterium]
MEEQSGKKWLRRIVDFINPLRDPSLTVAAVLTFIEEAGQNDAWYIIVFIALVNWLAVRGIVWLVVNFAFAITFISRRLWWAIKNPRLAWRLLDAVGHEEIIIGGFPSIGEGIILQDGTTVMPPALGASGIHIIGELPAGTEVPLLNMSNGQPTTGFQPEGANGFIPAANSHTYNGYAGQPGASFSQTGGSYVSQQNTEAFSQNFSRQATEAEEQIRQQLAAYTRLLDDWIQFTEEKWRTVSDSQLGWKPLRGRWSSWDDIFQDVYAAKTSDPLAQAAQTAGDATARRFDSAKEKGSAASAVSCFMRDMMTLRNALELLQQQSDTNLSQTSAAQPVVQPPGRRFGGGSSGSLFNNGSRSSLIRRPTQIFVDADTRK